jgi:hypothetical protein
MLLLLLAFGCVGVGGGSDSGIVVLVCFACYWKHTTTIAFVCYSKCWATASEIARFMGRERGLQYFRVYFFSLYGTWPFNK